MSRWLSLLMIAVALAPAIFIAVLVYEEGCSMAARDDWEMAPLIVKAHNGTLTFHDLFLQQQESRTFFPKLVFVALAMTQHWDVRIEMWISIAVCCATAAGVFVLLRRSGLTKPTSALLMLLMTPLIFSPAQHEIWLLASGFPSFVPAFCVVAGLVVVTSRWHIATKFISCLLIAVLSSFTLANGLLAWGLTFPLVFVIERRADWLRWLAGWFGASGLAALAYLYDYRQPPDVPSFAAAPNLLGYVEYLLAFLGSPLGRSGNAAPLAASMATGAFALAIFAAAIVYTFRKRSLLRAAAPWFALGAYSIACGVLAALGRASWGISQSLESRYVAFSLYLIVALIGVGALIVANAPQEFRRGALKIAGVLVALYVSLQTFCFAASIHEFRFRGAMMRLAHSAILFSHVCDTSKVIENLTYPRAWFVDHQVSDLDSLGLLRPPLIRTTDIAQLRHADADGENASGYIDGLLSRGRSECTIWGWALLEDKRRAPDCVALAYSLDGNRWHLFSMSDSVESRADVVTSLGDGAYRQTGWRATFPRSAVPTGASISAWAVDLHDTKLFRLKSNLAELRL